ncbi:CrcB protein [Candidatus Planktophila limnetica]|uniref:Fluoride-specific ion channel n=1 Tax=Candidatus Planktophila limnetica TaxID=573600 RepID=A0A249LDA3_9ACTN|nr:CrcB family protein [Candidatus Planktophila limnetica]ASY27110.1 CrcB protein [Candidatus Planktophila limnetica]
MNQIVNVRSISLVSLGGVLGSLLRYTIGELFTSSRTSTLIANLLGVAIATFLLVLMQRRGSTDQRHFWLPGFCAGLTTFSAVALLTLQPSDGGTMYLSASVIASLAIIAIVMPIARKVIPARS